MLGFVVAATLFGVVVPLLVHASLRFQSTRALRGTLGRAGIEILSPSGLLVGLRARLGSRSLRVVPALLDRRQITLNTATAFAPEVSLQIHFEDDSWSVLGDEALAAALATAELRAAVEAGDQLHLADGQLGLLLYGPERAGRGARALVELAQRLEDSPRLGPLLEATALHDADPRARAEAIPHLLARVPEREAALARDPDPEVRLAVARVVGGEQGFAVAREILMSEIFRPELQQAALRHLRSRYPDEKVGPVLVDALSAADDELLGALVTALGALGQDDAGDALRAALPTAELTNAARIAEALAQLEGERAEPDLLAVLDRLPASGPRFPDEQDLACTVADALGRVGNVACLPPLMRLAERVPRESPVGISLKVALELVRARTGETTLRGTLALAAEAPESSGRLSRPEP